MFADYVYTVAAGLVRAIHRSEYQPNRMLPSYSEVIHSYRPLQPNSPSMIISKEHRRTIYENLFKGAYNAISRLSLLQELKDSV